MAQMMIILRRDPASGKQNIIVKLDSDPDALPLEHEQMHRQLVEKLIGKGIHAEDLGEVIIEREQQPEITLPASDSDQGERKRQKSEK